ncbi:MAG: hypothetical protein K9H64_00920 [Bacteroidales bacterium]|nr:hypothetical protein [Bacteroidales bacterium]MCF8454786.1 hypothetical protein [Bacteroidales bacterium]
MTKNLLFLLIISISLCSYSQDSRFYQSFKFGAFTEYTVSPAYISGYSQNISYDPITGDKIYTNKYEFENMVDHAIVNYSYNARINIFDLSDNMSIGINANPSIGITISEAGIGSINIPGFISFNMGAGSTYNSLGNLGGFVGVGYEFTKIHLLSSDELFEPDNIPGAEKPITVWTQPMIIGGLRWWTKKNKLMEVSLKYGFGSNDFSLVIDDTDARKPMSIQVNWGYFINY